MSEYSTGELGKLLKIKFSNGRSPIKGDSI